MNRDTNNKPSAHNGPPWILSPYDRGWIDRQWLGVGTCMLVSATVFFGYRAVLSVVLTACAAGLSYIVVGAGLRRYRPDRPAQPWLHILSTSLLLGGSLPLSYRAVVPVMSGAILGAALHGVGRASRVRLDPIALVMVITCLAPEVIGGLSPTATMPPMFARVSAVLRPQRVVTGDAFDAGPSNQAVWSWWSPVGQGYDAIRRADPYAYWITHQHAVLALDAKDASAWLGSLELCAMGELLLGPIPGSVGGTSRGMMMAVGFYLMYRRLAWWRGALVGLIAWGGTLMIMPLVYDHHWSLVALRLIDVGAVNAIVYLGYALLTSPFALMVLVLAPRTAPMGAPGKTLYYAVIGSGLVLGQWIVATPSAPYLALVAAGLLSRPMDSFRSPRPMIPIPDENTACLMAAAEE